MADLGNIQVELDTPSLLDGLSFSEYDEANIWEFFTAQHIEHTINDVLVLFESFYDMSLVTTPFVTEVGGMIHFFNEPTSYKNKPTQLGKISGKIRDRDGNFVSKRVYVFERETMTLFSSAMSNPTSGEYEFEVPNNNKYLVLTLDDASSPKMNAVVLDRISVI